ncbi:MAG: hypothetical protein H6710_01570 [Myxococcales bacterium]|nr:hypothetical protein [Myxococcales bacterium]
MRFESDELVEELIDAGVEGSLPLLQFALAELWEVRDHAAAVITRANLGRSAGSPARSLATATGSSPRSSRRRGPRPGGSWSAW